MKLPRTMRLDPSDNFVFERAAEPGEWAVSGAFVFHGVDAASLGRKARVALRSGFLGIASLGWSTLVEVAEGDDAVVVEQLADQLMAAFGAVDRASALEAARAEVAFAAALCDHPLGTLIAVHRTPGPEGLAEQFRTLVARADRAALPFVAPGEDDQDHIDLTRLVERDR